MIQKEGLPAQIANKQVLDASLGQLLVRKGSVHLSSQVAVTGSPWLVYQVATHEAHVFPFGAKRGLPVTGSIQSTSGPEPQFAGEEA